MIEIKDLLGRFDNLLLSENTKVEAIKEVLQKNINLEVQNTEIKIKNNTIYLDVKPIYKNEIFMHQEKIMDSLEEILGKKSPKDIR